MVNINDIKSKAQAVKDRVSGDGGNLGPDRGTMDQETARIERAKQEARKEAKRERRDEQIEKARKQAKEQAKRPDTITGRVSEAINTAVDAVDDGDGEVLDDFGTAMQTDFDGDGEPLGSELGLQTEVEAQQRQQAENQTFQQLTGRVTANENDIQDLDTAFSADRGGSQGQEDVGFGGSLEDMGFDEDDEVPF